jgi:hypothetical protein
MIYKIIKQDEFGTVFGRIDDDGLCRVTCVAENPEFQDYLKNNRELQDADGNVMTDASAYIASLP